MILAFIDGSKLELKNAFFERIIMAKIVMTLNAGCCLLDYVYPTILCYILETEICCCVTS